MTEPASIEKRQGNRGLGRKRGIPNKTTAVIKDAIAMVYARLQDRHENAREEAHAHFLDWAEQNPTEFYKIAAKLIPLQVAGNIGIDAKVTRLETVIVRPPVPDS